MGFPAARIGDFHSCPMVNPGPVPHVGGPVMKGQFNVLTGGSPQARVGDLCVCSGPPDSIAKGSMTVLVGGSPAARQYDPTVHGGVIVAGYPAVLIGDLASGVDIPALATPDPPCLRTAQKQGAPFVRG
ncbi:PAAR domain-containing protein [Novosphingobium album (ex Liu et al. 2023)]|uniref:PAAR domain-containing protein n=1 Tax=Novosphingobium album (ex Liu et al. 2023) TaxID=3031130 RepID=A0ABT5WV38_9SPHN|nr:PAAR domain-containing protein [Novosphingobium album (ex Liu et al. 2023)]MDE8653722.1 PAAR domain-containing protein [Novosphingobium album (ex Liu et al. 2023)]